MKITKGIRALLKSKGFAQAETVSEDDARVQLYAKLGTGEITAKELADADSAPSSAKEAVSKLIDEKLDAKFAKFQESLEKSLGKKVEAQPDQKTAESKTPGSLEDLVEKAVSKRLADSQVSPVEVFVSKGLSGRVDVKPMKDCYSTSKSNLHYQQKGHLTGQPVLNNGRQMESKSQLDNAVIGAWFKWTIGSQLHGHLMPPKLKMTDRDRDLLKYALHEMDWTGYIGPVGNGGIDVEQRRLADMEIKALLDDSTSGGSNAVPLVYDDAVVTTALLYGQLAPFVNTINLSRGNQVHAYSIQRPTITSNVAEGTSIPLYNTSSFIASLDTTIHTAVGAMEIGLYWEDDSPVNLGDMISKFYGEAAQKWLDDNIATGDGVNGPTGIFTSSNTMTVPSAMGEGGPLTIGDAEALLFGLSLQEQSRPGAFMAYVGNETTYRRFRSIPVGADDARRVLGTDERSYSLMQKPYKVNGTISDNMLAYCNLMRYRLYRRLGTSIRWETAGQTLALKNTSLLVMRMRYGGQPELGAGFAVMTDAATAG